MNIDDFNNITTQRELFSTVITKFESQKPDFSKLCIADIICRNKNIKEIADLPKIINLVIVYNRLNKITSKGN